MSTPIYASDPFEKINSTLLSLLVHKQTMSQQQEELKLREKEFKIREKEETAKEAQRQAAGQAGQNALAIIASQSPQIQQLLARQFPMTNTAPGTAMPFGGMNQLVPFNAQMIPTNVAAGISDAMQEFQKNQAALKQSEAQTGLALADTSRANAQTANVQQDTAQDAELFPIRKKKELADLERVTEVTRGQRLQNAYQVMVNQRDPQRVNSARMLFETGGVTWGEARKVAGLPAGGINDNARFVSATNAKNQEAMKMQGFATQMRESDLILNSLHAKGVRIGFLPSLTRTGTSPSFDAIVNSLSSKDQQQLVNAERMFGDAYRFMLSGQQSSDKESMRMLNAVTPQYGDTDEEIAQKRRMRQVMIRIADQRAGGALDPITAARQSYAAALITNDANTVALFKDILTETAANTGNPNAPPSGAPTDASNLPIRTQRVDSLINTGLRRGRR